MMYSKPAHQSVEITITITKPIGKCQPSNGRDLSLCLSSVDWRPAVRLEKTCGSEVEGPTGFHLLAFIMSVILLSVLV